MSALRIAWRFHAHPHYLCKLPQKCCKCTPTEAENEFFNDSWIYRIRATSHMRLRARDHYTSSTLIGGKGRSGPSPLHTTLEGPMEYVNARWMYNLHGFLHAIEWIMLHHRLDCFQKPPLGSRPNKKPGRLWQSKRLQPLIFSNLSCVRTRMNRIPSK